MGFSDPEKGGKRKESNFTCFSAKSKNYLFWGSHWFPGQSVLAFLCLDYQDDHPRVIWELGLLKNDRLLFYPLGWYGSQLSVKTYPYCLSHVAQSQMGIQLCWLLGIFESVPLLQSSSHGRWTYLPCPEGKSHKGSDSWTRAAHDWLPCVWDYPRILPLILYQHAKSICFALIHLFL
jgi:hypothetical protein